MKRIFAALIFLGCMAFPIHAQTSGNTPPPPPYCTSANAGALYTNTGTSPATVYTCSYYNLAWQWIINPSYGGLIYYPTVPSTCSGALPVFLAGWPDTKEYVCVNGVPEAIGGAGSGVTTFAAPSASWPTWLVPTVTTPASTPSLAVAAGTIPLSNGGTGATTAPAALANLGAASAPAYVSTAPSGACNPNGSTEYLTTTTPYTLYTCNTTWQQGGSGGGSGTVNSGTAWSPAFYSATGTAVGGTTPFTGLEYWLGSAAPAAATSAQVQGVIGAGVYDVSGAAAARQANLSILPGTYVDGNMCTYMASGTLLNCNTAIPSGGTGVCNGSTDDTTAFQTAATNLTNGGQIVVPITGNGCLIAGSGGFSLPNRGTTLQGISRGFNVDPDAVSQGSSGSKLYITGDGVYLGTSSYKTGGLSLDRLYFWGNTGTVSKAAIYIENQVDQAHLDNLDLGGNFLYGLYVTSDSDALKSHRFNALGLSGYGIYYTSASLVSYSEFTECSLSDNNNSGFYQETSTTTNNMWLRLSNCEAVRDVHTSQTNPGNIVIGTNYAVLTNMTSLSAGYSISGLQVSGASDVILNGNYDSIIGGNFTGASGCGITINGNNALVQGGNYGSNTTADICVASGSTDTRLYVPTTAVITDSGTRTVINNVGTNAGDPNSAGSWNGVTKWAGLIINDTTDSVQWLYLSSSSRISLAGSSGLTLTTTGTSGASTLVGSTLNIPVYSSGGGGGAVTNITSAASPSGCTVSSGLCVVGSPASTISLTIPSGYNKLELDIDGAQSGTAGSTNDVVVVFNSDTSATDYYYAVNYSNDISANPAQTFLSNTNPGAHICSLPGNSSGIDGSCISTISNYCGTSFNKRINTTSGNTQTATFTNAQAANSTVEWQSTAAITSITITISGGSNFVAGTSFSLYGVQ